MNDRDVTTFTAGALLVASGLNRVQVSADRAVEARVLHRVHQLEHLWRHRVNRAVAVLSCVGGGLLLIRTLKKQRTDLARPALVSHEAIISSDLEDGLARRDTPVLAVSDGAMRATCTPTRRAGELAATLRRHSHPLRMTTRGGSRYSLNAKGCRSTPLRNLTVHASPNDQERPHDSFLAAIAQPQRME
jgi:hypothetical protein